jgi:hypothetical protein
LAENIKAAVIKNVGFILGPFLVDICHIAAAHHSKRQKSAVSHWTSVYSARPKPKRKTTKPKFMAFCTFSGTAFAVQHIEIVYF